MRQHEQAMLLVKKAADDEALLAEIGLDRELLLQLVRSLHEHVEMLIC
jgi:hypothetical protein